MAIAQLAWHCDELNKIMPQVVLSLDSVAAAITLEHNRSDPGDRRDGDSGHISYSGKHSRHLYFP
jgi:hypothetical protein